MTSPVPPPRPRRRLRWIGLICLALAVGLTAGIVNALTLTRDASALRAAVVSSSGLQTDFRIQGSVGPVLCQLGRIGLRWVDGVPAEARAGLAALRGASVAVHTLNAAPAAGAQERWMADAAQTMSRRGWTRNVSVLDGSDAVVVFTRRDGWVQHQWRVCVAVCSGDQLVVVEAKLHEGKLESLLELVAAHAPDWRTI